jgi:membrane-bound ClpP family serine protease
MDKNKNELKKLIGQRGIATTEFKPCGKFMIDNNVYEGITGGSQIDKDAIIKITNVEGSKIIVEKEEV